MADHAHSMTSLMKTDIFVDGHWLPTDKRFTVTNPATGDVLSEVADADSTIAERAIDAAHKALPGWQAKTPKERSDILRRWYQAIMTNKKALGELMSAEQGKPVPEAIAEIEYGASFVDWFAGEAERVYGDVLPLTANDKRSWIIKQPIGVCTAITPWNFPNAMITRKVAPALAAGCTMVVKPPQLTPLSALAMAQLASEVGVPDGVINILPSTASREVGEVLTTHPLVKKFTFTGSTEVGKALLKQCADTVKKTSMELGGNAPFIVFDDADLELAAEQLIACKFRNAGQTCVSANRVLVQASVVDDFIAKLKPKVEALKVGPGTEDGVDFGPLINQEAVDKVQRLVTTAQSDGATLVTGGEQLTDLGELYYAATILRDVVPSMDISQEEIFGPVIAINAFDSEAEGVSLANDTEFGLAGYFCASDFKRIFRVSEQLKVGMVGINAGAISHAYNAFGGVKESGTGREGSKYGIAEYMETKTVVLGGFDQ